LVLPPLGQIPQLGGDPTGQQIVDVAALYVGMIPYENGQEWNGNPGLGVDPRQENGWDCSGFTYWLDQNYGGYGLVEGSHYQYQQLQNAGEFNNGLAQSANSGDWSQLQPGDLIYIDSGWYGGAGAELNNAGHVAVFYGYDANGQPLIIHSANDTDGTIISSASYYQGSILGVARIW
jgi:cell wall-associated NlpC family hydrolase